MPTNKIRPHDFVSIEDNGDSYDVLVWTIDGEGFVVEAVGERSSAEQVADMIAEAFASWINRPRQQVLISLADGAQVFLKTTDTDPTVQVRSRISGTWGLPFDKDVRPHQNGTVYVGEW